MANYDFTTYEEAVLRVLAPMLDPLGKVKILKGYGGEIVLTEDGLVLITLGNFPAVLVEISGADYSPGPGQYYTEAPKVGIHVCSRSLRSQDEARGGEAGCYPINREILSRLAGKKLKEDLHPLFPKTVQRLVAGVRDGQEHIMVYRWEFNFGNPLCELEA